MSRLPAWIVTGLLLSAAAATAFDYTFMVFDARRDNVLARRRANHEQIVGHTHNAPERFRILVPYTLEVPIRLAGLVWPRDKAIDRVYAVFYFVALTALLWSLFAYLRRWFTDTEALVGTLIVSSTISTSLKEYYLPWSLLEPTFVALLLIFVLDRRRLAIGVLVALATLNRETGVFLVILYALTADPRRETLWLTAAYSLIAGAVLLALRVALGDAERFYTIEVLWRENMRPLNLWTTAANTSVFLGAVWVLAALGWRSAPTFVRRSALIVPLYAAAFAVWGLWYWTRAWMTLYPIFIPLALSFIFRPRELPLRRIVGSA